MERLPTELIHLIYAELDSDDVASLRLLNRQYAGIGTQYLFPDGQVDFYLCRSGLSRLKSIGDHPELRHYVKAVQYQAHTLELPQKSFKKWKSMVKSTYSIFSTVGLAKPVPIPRTKSAWRKHYNTYLEMIQEQIQIIEQAQDLSVLAEFFTKCPNLKSLVFSNSYVFHNYEKIHQPFEETLEGSADYLEPKGIRQLEMLLTAMVNAQTTKLTAFRAGSVSWKAFLHIDDILPRLVSSTFTTLKCLHLSLTTGYTDELFGIEVVECRRKLSRGGSVRKFLEKIPTLEDLGLEFDFMNEDWDYDGFITEPRHPADLEDIVPKGFVWPRLHTLRLGCFEASQESLFDFLNCHKDTLRQLILTDVELRHQHADDGTKVAGSWMTLLPKIRKTLNLDYGCLNGQISAPGIDYDEDEMWNIGHDEVEDDDGWREDIFQYLIGATDECPLSEDNMEFNF